MPATQTVLCLSKFTHIRPGCLTADASDLQIGLVPAITIRSHKTSAEYEFTLTRRYQDAEGELTCWVYSRVDNVCPIAEVKIFND